MRLDSCQCSRGKAATRVQRRMYDLHVILFIVLASPVVTWSHQAREATREEVLTVEQAVALAFAHNRQVQNAALEVEKAGDDVAAAQTRRWPSLNFSIHMRHVYAMTGVKKTWSCGYRSRPTRRLSQALLIPMLLRPRQQRSAHVVHHATRG
jgi:outer membrane protein TolC